MSDLYLVRHGQTELNVQNILQGWQDSPLTERGSRIMARPQHDRVLAVSHGSACQEFLRCVTGGGEQPDNGAVLHFGYCDGAFSLLDW